MTPIIERFAFMGISPTNLQNFVKLTELPVVKKQTFLQQIKVKTMVLNHGSLVAAKTTAREYSPRTQGYISSTYLCKSILPSNIIAQYKTLHQDEILMVVTVALC